MNQLTIRGYENELSDFLHTMAKNEHISLNQTAIKLLLKGAGIEKGEKTNCIGSSLDSYIGSWSKSERQSFDEAVSCFNQIDEEIWK